MTGLVRR